MIVVSPDLHPILQQQIRQCGFEIAQDDQSEALRSLLQTVSRSYFECDDAVWDLRRSLKDVSKERVRLREQLQHQVLHDPLTGLANRALFHDRVRHALDRAERNCTSIGVMYLDVDNFKMVNDGAGHTVGDKVLKAIAAHLRSCIRQSDTIARLGGDEFAVLLEDVEGKEAIRTLTDRILEGVSSSIVIDGKPVFVSVSIGVAFTPLQGATFDDLLRNADAAMVAAKEHGKGWCEFYDPYRHAATRARRELEYDLIAAVSEGQFVLHYQPTVSLKDGSIQGAEALLRWDHPKLGLIAPMEFIPLAEESGLILPIGRWVLEEACRQGKAWQEQYGRNLTMCVNLSVRQLRTDDFINEVANILFDTKFPPSSLVLEITESIMLEGGTAMVERLEALRSLGVRLAIDDFGTGYSSLGYLQNLPVDILKIDKSFVQGITNGERCPVMEMIISLANSLNLQTVVEGIDSHNHIPVLREAGCDLAQGYFFARPGSSTVIGNLLNQATVKAAA